MGFGYFKPGSPGTLDLYVSFRYRDDAGNGFDVPDTELDLWKKAFAWASLALDFATDGGMRFGQIFYNNHASGREVDLRILNITGESTDHGAIGTKGTHSKLTLDAREHMNVILHELGHYLFDLGNEYPIDLDTDGVYEIGNCITIRDTDKHACIMEYDLAGLRLDEVTADFEQWGPTNPRDPYVSEFCDSTNHEQHPGVAPGDKPPPTDQSNMHMGESCWETMTSRVDTYGDSLYPSFTLTGTQPDSAEAEGPLSQQPHQMSPWKPLVKPSKFALLLDRSGSMSIGSALVGVKVAAKFWVELEMNSGDGNRLAIIDYASDVNDLWGMVPIQAGDVQGIKDDIDVLNTGGLTSIGGALDRALTLMGSNLNDRAARQAILLFSDGRHNTGIQPTDAMYRQIKESGTRVYSVGFGNVDMALLKRVGVKTRGYDRYVATPTDPNVPEDWQVSTALGEISGLLHSHGIASSKALLTTVGTPGSSVDVDVIVDSDTDRVTFVMMHPSGTVAEMQLLDPALDPVPSGGKVVRVDPADSPYTFYIVNEPRPGQWRMRAINRQRADLYVSLFAFASGSDVIVSLSGTNAVYKRNQEIVLEARAVYREALTGMAVRAVPDNLTGANPAEVDEIPFKESPLGSGVYRGRVALPDIGAYSFKVEYKNEGGARVVIPPRLRAEPPAIDFDIPAFTVIEPFQLKVGPLPTGRDLDRESTSWRDRILRWLRTLWEQPMSWIRNGFSKRR